LRPIRGTSLLHELLPILVRRQLGVLTEKPRKETGIVIANFVADGLDALARARQQPLGGLDPQPLQVVQRLVTCRALEAAHEVADAHAVVAGHILEAELVGEVFLQPMLDLQNDQVLMQLLPAKAHAPRGVVALHFVEDVAGRGAGHIGAAEALDQVDVQVAGRSGAAGAIDIVGVGQVLVLVQPDLRKAFGKAGEEAPVGRRLLAIEQAGFGQPEHTTGLGAQHRTAGMLFTQPWQHLWITLQEVVEIVPVGREDDHIGVVQAAVDR